MKILYQKEIAADDDIEVVFPIGQGHVMTGKKDLTILIAGIGGEEAGPADVTMSVTVLADIAPFAVSDLSGSSVDVSKWVDITKAGYRLDTNAAGSASFDFVGDTEATAMVRFENLDADKLKFLISFDAAPTVTNATILIKGSVDSI